MEEFDHLCVDLKNKKIATSIVFQGGGAKGIFHVGALQAIEEAIQDEDSPCFELKAYAGTSIGALVAALACVGFKSTDLIDDDGKFPLSPDMNVPIAENIVGKTGWKKVKFFRDFVRLFFDPRDFVDRKREAFALVTVGLFVPILFFCGLYSIYSLFGVNGVVGYFFLALAALYFFFRRLLAGIVDLQPFAQGLNTALTEKFLLTRNARKGQRTDDSIKSDGLRFGDLSDDGRKLRIVSTCISSEELKLFSEESSKDVVVADAIVASMAIPAVVKPITIQDRQYWDGGIVSNAPSWAFDDLRKIDPDLITISLELFSKPKEVNSAAISPEERNTNANPLDLKLKNVINAALFGSQSLGVRTSHRLFRHAVYSDEIGLLDFELKPSEIRNSLLDAKYSKQRYIARNFLQIPDEYKYAMDKVTQQFQFQYAFRKGDQSILTNPNYDGPRVRVFFAQEMIGISALKIRFSNDDGAPTCDDRLILPFDSSLAGKVHQSGDWELIDAKQMQTGFLSERRDRYRKAMKWSKAKWCLCVPIDGSGGLQSGVPPGVVIIEGDIPYTDFGLGEEFERIAWKPIVSLIAQAFIIAIHAENDFNADKFEEDS